MIELLCEHCEGRYKIEVAHRKIEAIRKMVDYAICPHCNQKRNPHLGNEVHTCEICHVPTKGNHRLCNNCYINEYRRKKRLEKLH